MKEAFDPISHFAMVKIPEATLGQLSFAANNKASTVRAWVDQLRATQIINTSVSLYRALPEIVRLKVEPSVRFDMLEALRPSVHQAVVGLTKEFLHQPLNLPEQAQKTAILAQALQKNMLEGYSSVAQALGKQSRISSSERQLFVQALHRGMNAIGLIILRSFQLYTQVPAGLWQHAHLLYRCAHYYSLHTQGVEDAIYTHGATTIEQAYMRVVAFGAARLSQVSQNEASQLYDALAEWCRYVQVQPTPNAETEHLYWVNLERDRGPQLKARYDGSLQDALIEINFKPLLNQLTPKENLGVDYKRLRISEDFPSSLLQHVRDAWSSLHNRDLERRPAGEVATVCVGFSDCHFQLCGEQTFETFLSQGDTLSKANAGTDYASLYKNTLAEDSRQLLGQCWDITLLNISAGGYCLEWAADSSPLVEAGDLIAVREAGRHSWNLCSVRWIRRLKEVSQMGLQLISTQAMAYAAAARLDDGSFSSYRRAFLIPSARQGQVPASLLTASLPFQEYHAVRLKLGAEVSNGKLEGSLLASAKLRQFAITLPNG